MRTIKFRAWDTDKKEFKKDTWLSDFTQQKEGILFLNSDFGGLGSRLVFQQFTGLLDKNGKEIWEGDIVRDVSDSDLVFEVKWDEKQVGYYMPKEYDEEYIYSLCTPELEIIGNIYENADLLKK